MDTTLNATVSYDEKRLDALFKKSVPAPVQAYISLLNGEVKPEKKAKTKRPKAPKQDESAQSTYGIRRAELQLNTPRVPFFSLIG